MRSWIMALSLTICLLMSAPARAARIGEMENLDQLINQAVNTFENFKADPGMDWFRHQIKYAKGVLIVPSLVRAGFIFGGSGGSGVLLARNERDGYWSYPGFYSLGSGSFGFQAGVEKSEVVLMIMTQRGMDSMLTSSFKLGVDASVAAGPVGTGAKLQTTDVVAYARSRGIFGGISFEGAVITTRDAWNATYYGQRVRPTQIFITTEVVNPGADVLRESIRRIAE